MTAFSSFLIFPPIAVELAIAVELVERLFSSYSDVERNFDSFVSTNRDTPDTLPEQPTHSSPNPMTTRRRSKRLNHE